MSYLKKRFAHWNARYVYDRLIWSIQHRMHPDYPWLTKDAVTFLSSWLRRTDVGLEWGAGKSTPWFAKRVASLTSIEHDPVWYAKVGDSLRKQGVENARLLLLATTAREGERAPYVRVVDDIVPHSLDFVLVDGRLRAECALAALDRLRTGGILIIDNIERYLPSDSRSPCAYSHDGPVSGEWALFSRVVELWRCMWTTNGVWDTAIWFVP